MAVNKTTCLEQVTAIGKGSYNSEMSTCRKRKKAKIGDSPGPHISFFKQFFLRSCIGKRKPNADNAFVADIFWLKGNGGGRLQYACRTKPLWLSRGLR